MSGKNSSLSVKMDVDMSAFDRKIDIMDERLRALKKDIASVNSGVTAAFANSTHIYAQSSSATSGYASGRNSADRIFSGMGGFVSKGISPPSAAYRAASAGVTGYNGLKTPENHLGTESKPVNGAETIRREVEKILKKEASMISR